jgi:DNA-directed RNA polymerase subunit RPC12/RpoP
MTDSPGAARCPHCGSPLAVSLLPDGSVSTEDLTVSFRRHTDYVVCERCLVSHRVDELRARSTA